MFLFLPTTVAPLPLDLLFCGQPKPWEMPSSKDVVVPARHAPHVPILLIREPQDWDLEVTWGCALLHVPSCKPAGALQVSWSTRNWAF